MEIKAINKIRLPDMKRFLTYRMRDIRCFWYKVRHGIDIMKIGSMLPDTGKGQYVDVFCKGEYIEIVNHSKNSCTPYGTIRLIPYRPNHGVMVEYSAPSGRVGWRVHCDYQAFHKMGIHESSMSDKKDATIIEINKKSG